MLLRHEQIYEDGFRKDLQQTSKRKGHDLVREEIRDLLETWAQVQRELKAASEPRYTGDHTREDYIADRHYVFLARKIRRLYYLQFM